MTSCVWGWKVSVKEKKLFTFRAWGVFLVVSKKKKKFKIFFFFLHEKFLADMRGILREMMSQQEVSSEFQKMSVKYCEVLNYFATTY